MGDRRRTEAGGLRDALSAANEGFADLQADWRPARGADPSGAHQDREHSAHLRVDVEDALILAEGIEI